MLRHDGVQKLRTWLMQFPRFFGDGFDRAVTGTGAAIDTVIINTCIRPPVRLKDSGGDNA